MYAQSIVERRLVLAREQLGFMPEYHSVAEVDTFAEHLKKSEAFDKNGKKHFTRDYVDWEVRWMENEHALVMCDAAYALTRYCYLSDEENNIRRFEFRIPQMMIFSIISELEEKGASIELMLLKARQLGASTLVELLIGILAEFREGVNAIIASADREKSAKMAKMLFLSYDRLPDWLKPTRTRFVEAVPGMIEFGNMDSAVSVQHGAQMSGIARGTTPTRFHLCVSGRTLIRTADSRVIPMREITDAERVISLSGKSIKIVKAWKSPRRDEMTAEIRAWGTPTSLSLTRDHRVLTETGWKEAKDISSGDHLIYPKRAISSNGKIHMKHYERWRRSSKRESIIKPTFEFGRLVGLYLAEGSIAYSSKRTACTVVYSIHRDEDDRVRSWIECVFGRNDRSSQRRKTSKTVNIGLGHRGFAEWLIEHFGTKDEKRVSDLCWSLGEDFCRGLVYGYLSGDGHYQPESNEVYATSVRVAIPIGIRELITSLGYGWSSISFREAGNWYNRNCRDAWVLVVAGTTARNWRSFFGMPVFDSTIDRPFLNWHWTPTGDIAVSVESVGEGFSQDFYDIEVGDVDHAFLTASGIVHNSEVASFKDPVNQIEAAIWRAVHPSPNVFGVLESTAEGETGWWADRWRYTKSRWAVGQARLCPLFLPWFCGIDIYPKPAFFATHPIPALWQPNRDTQEHVARAEMYVRSNSLIRRYLCAQRSGPRGGWWTDGHMPIEQQWFWEIGHEEAKENGSEPTWFQEMAGDDVEAFQKSYDSVFGHKVIAEVDSRREQNYIVYGIVGESVDECHEPDESEVDYSRERIPLTHMSPRGERFRWELVPLKYGRGWTWEEDPEKPVFNEAGHLRVTDREGRTIWLDPEAKLFVFELPQAGVDYGLGGDCGAGTGHDFTSFTITKKGVRGEPDVEAAQWRSNRIGHVTSFAWAMPVALYYARAMKGARYEQPLAAIEQLASVGDTCQLQMKKMGYTRFFRFHRYDSHKVSPKNSTKDGWYTTGWSRPMLVDGFIEDVKKGWFTINSPWTANECRHFEVHLTKRGVKREHSDDSHDDGIFSAAISTFVLHDMEAKTERAKKRFTPGGDGSGGDGLGGSGLTVDIGPYAGHVVSTRKQRIVTLSDLRYNPEELERHRY